MLKVIFSILVALFFIGSQICIATPLVDAIKANDIHLVKNLIQEGSNVDDRDEEGWTALMFAAANGHNQIMQVLLDNKGISMLVIKTAGLLLHSLQ